MLIGAAAAVGCPCWAVVVLSVFNWTSAKQCWHIILMPVLNDGKQHMKEFKDDMH